MAREKGSMVLPSNIELGTDAPLDARTVVETKADLTVAANFEHPYEGLPVYVAAEKKYYVLTALPVTSAANWKALEGGGGGTPEWDDILNKPDDLVEDADYVHTDNNYTNADKAKLDTVNTTLDVNVTQHTSAYETVDASFTNGSDTVDIYYARNPEEGEIMMGSLSLNVNGDDSFPIATKWDISLLEDGKQDKLTAGQNISIVKDTQTGETVISATGDVSVAWDEITGKPADLVQDTDYVHTDNNFSDAEKEKIARAQSAITTIEDAIGNLEDLTTEDRSSLVAALEETRLTASEADRLLGEELLKKQDKLTAGDGITIEGDVISATGMEVPIDSTLSPTSVNPVQNKAITVEVVSIQSAITTIEAAQNKLSGSVAKLEVDFDAAQSAITTIEEAIDRLDAEKADASSVVAMQSSIDVLDAAIVRLDVEKAAQSSIVTIQSSITTIQTALADRYTKTETDAKIAEAMTDVDNEHFHVVTVLPDAADAKENHEYVLVTYEPGTTTIATEVHYLFYDGEYHQRTTTVSLDGYATEQYVDNKTVDMRYKVEMDDAAPPESMVLKGDSEAALQPTMTFAGTDDTLEYSAENESGSYAITLPSKAYVDGAVSSLDTRVTANETAIDKKVSIEDGRTGYVLEGKQTGVSIRSVTTSVADGIRLWSMKKADTESVYTTMFDKTVVGKDYVDGKTLSPTGWGVVTTGYHEFGSASSPSSYTVDVSQYGFTSADDYDVIITSGNRFCNFGLTSKTATSFSYFVCDIPVGSAAVGQRPSYYAVIAKGYGAVAYTGVLPEGGTAGQALVKRSGDDGDVAWADAGGGTITLDDAMSDTSENGVKNKVIKSYVDNKTLNPTGWGVAKIGQVSLSSTTEVTVDITDLGFMSVDDYEVFLTLNDATTSNIVPRVASKTLTSFGIKKSSSGSNIPVNYVVIGKGYGGGSSYRDLILDTAMSGTSENGVENKVIKAYVDSMVSVDDTLDTTSTHAVQNKVITEKVNDLQSQIGNLGEPFRVKQFQTVIDATLPMVTEEVANTAIPNIDLTIDDTEGADYQIAGMLSYEVFDAETGGNRINCFPVCQFTMNSQKTIRIRMMCGGTARKTAKRISAWVLLKHR